MTIKEPTQSKLRDINSSAYDRLSRKEKLIFLSGLFDGEGSFGIWSQGKGRVKRFYLKIETTDEDMILRFKEYFRIGWLGVRKPRKAHYKTTYTWKCRDRNAWRVMGLMIPYMCYRRQEKYYGLVEPTGYGNEDWGSYLQKQTRLKTVNERCAKITRRKNG